MDGHGRTGTGRRLQILGAVVLVVGSLAVALALALRGPEVAYLPASPQAPWITDARPVNSNLQQWGREQPPEVRFVRRFELTRLPAEARLTARALRHFRVTLNGTPLPGPPDANAKWRHGLRTNVAPQLRLGANELRVEVTNRYGPALLSLRLDGLDAPLSSGPEFAVFVDGKASGRAVPADDTRREMGAHLVETPAQALASRAGALLAGFAGASVAGALAFRFVPPAQAVLVPRVVLGLVGFAWIWLFATKIARIPLELGFDARHHLQYVDLLLQHRRVPLATDGWSTFHPPLFYALAAFVRDAGQGALRALPWFAGLATVGVVAAGARRLHPERPAIVAWAVAFAATLPVHLYSSTYFTNESLHALFTSAALLLVLEALGADRTQRKTLLGIGLFLGLAALTKFTVLALVPVALFFLALKLWRVEATSLRAGSVEVATVLVPFLVLSGWYYARNQWHLGSPVQGNWGHLPGVQAWWQQPGFHTWSYYTSFGEVLRHGYFAGFVSFWDGAYSSFWADGLVGGLGTPSYRHAFWNYDFMSAGFLLALPLSALLALGGAITLRRAFASPGPHRRAIHSFELTAIYALVYSFATLTLSLPFFSQAKSSYLLPLLLPLSLLFGRGVGAVDRRLAAAGPIARGVFAGGVATCLACLFLGFAG
jgi:hypothetical protein